MAEFYEMGIAPVKKLSGALNAVQNALADLKQYVADHSFADEAAEVAFFKYDKPQFVAEQLYAVELFTLETNKPVGDDLALKVYYEFELRHLRRFFDQHRFLYQYYLLDGYELDAVYFRRGGGPAKAAIEGLPELDPEFSTPGDYLFAKFLAFERLQEHLVNCLYAPVVPMEMRRAKKKKPFNWTGDKSNLIEVAYGIFCTMQINEGQVTIADIIEWLEESFGIDLTRYYRRFAEIKMRKTGSRTKYLDEMGEAVIAYMEDSEGIKARPPKK